jgi:predicted nucleotidyltransferase
LLEAAFRFVQAAAQLPGVQRIALIGSILSGRQNPKDVDLLVYVADDADLAPLASAARRLKGRLQGQNLGADVFLADARPGRRATRVSGTGLFLEGVPAWDPCLM